MKRKKKKGRVSVRRRVKGEGGEEGWGEVVKEQ
jgi:hypothetical protein